MHSCAAARKERKFMRLSKRADDEMRKISFERGVNKYAEGSCLVKFGDTHILCTASLEERLPAWLRNGGKGWITAEYSMMPRSAGDRIRREAAVGRQSGRTMEIQRLIGRSLRSVADLKQLGEKQVILDCDVLQADGGTRTAAISGAFIALYDCLGFMQKRKMLLRDKVVKDHIAAVSCGIVRGHALLDLDYAEDSSAAADANFVMTGKGAFVEIQSSGEEATFSAEQFAQMQHLAQKGIAEIIALQKAVLAE